MSETLYFSNNGYFDRRCMFTFGLSVKEGSNPIGFFGTGLKYAIAIILRLGGKVTILTRPDEGLDEQITFSKVTETVRGEAVDMVKYTCKRGAGDPGELLDAGFTAHLGLQWEAWMAYRELRCNCMDEAGVIGMELDTRWQTIVQVDSPLILTAHVNQNNYFITGEPIYKTDDVEIHEGSRPFHYYRGVAVMNVREKSIFSYNVLSRIELSEERTARYSWQIENLIEKAMQTMTDATLVRRVLRSEQTQDRRWDYSASKETSDVFREEAYQALKTGTLKNESARELLEALVHEKAEYEVKQLNHTEMLMLGRAIRFLQGMDIPVRDYPICPVMNLGQGVMGRALNGKIYIAEMAFMMGTKQVASTLMEEWVHLRHECPDFSRTMQNWLFDKLLTLGENINGVPL